MSYNDITKSKKEKQKMDENRLIYKKKAGIFITAIILADYLIRTCVNMLLPYFITTFSTEGGYADKFKLFNQVVSICLSVLSIFLIFFVGWLFTRDKRKTVIFSGSIYFGKSAAGLVYSLVSTVANCLVQTAGLNERTFSAIITVGQLITIPLIIAAAYFVFTAFEGINPKLETSLSNSEMLLHRAKNRYLVTYIIVAITTSFLVSGPSLIIPYCASYAMFDITEYSTAITVITKVLSWLSGVIGFTVIYYAGYKPYRNHTDGMSFVCISEITGTISGLIINIAMLPFNFLLTTVQSSGNYKLMLILSSITGATTLIALAVDIILIIFTLRFFFSKSKISLFVEDVPESIVENSTIENCTNVNSTDVNYYIPEN